MRPLLAKFFIYADNESEIDKLQSTLHDLVSSMYREGVIVSADKLNRLISQPSAKSILKQALK